MKIAITGLVSSGKSTVAKFLSQGKYPIYSADKEVAKLYEKNLFKKLIASSFKLKNNQNLKKNLKKLILKNEKNLNKLEKIIHPKVRKKMKKFFLQNKFKKFLICEIPLLVESKINTFFDLVIFVGSSKITRLKRYQRNGGSKQIFNILDKRQMTPNKKIKYCDHVVVNNSSLIILKKKIFNILSKYE
tara:strand:+ start:2493 stop:3056 length:564 start_codon:yes stop_codon:yes gene_type:complete